MSEIFERTRALIGDEALKKLNNSKVIVFGVGGVGGYIAEALARSGVGELHLVDNDVVSLSNINRQIIALHSTVGRLKTEVMKERILDVNPSCKVVSFNLFFSAENSSTFDFTKYDYVLDAIDSVKSKIELIRCVTNANTPIISALGAGNKLYTEPFEISDLNKTSVCPLARVLRRELKKIGINHLKVCYSKEAPLSPSYAEGEARTPSSIAFAPSIMGLTIAAETVKNLIK